MIVCKTPIGSLRLAVMAAAVAVVAVGCPDSDYQFDVSSWSGLDPVSPGGSSVSDMWFNAGFNDGFAEDDWYWQGYYDSYDTVDFGPIYYQGSDIPYLDGTSYEAGYWDGVWWAYNDGYFTAYRHAFIIGFSEGYDCAYWPDYLTFLAADQHTEYLDGGWSDGYNDGFSEGRVFGANDYESALQFDWLDALLDYESGTDLYFEEVDVGTGEYGPVYLYEYGSAPYDLLKSQTVKDRRKTTDDAAQDSGDADPSSIDQHETYTRPFIPSVRRELDVVPTMSVRSERQLRLDTSWLERVTTYEETTTFRKAAVRRTRAQ